jgi:hypothetical protein
MAVPKKDSLLVPYSKAFNDRLASAYATYHLTADDAAEYAVKHAAYIQAQSTLMMQRESGTRSESQTAARNAVKTELLQFARQLYSMVQADKTVSDADKILLGIRIRAAAVSIARPTVAPCVYIDSVRNRTVDLTICDAENPKRRGKPPRVASAWVYRYVGSDFPADPAAWIFAGSCTTRHYSVVFPNSLPAGTQVWICAAWVSPRQEVGPICTVLTTNLQGGGSAVEGKVKIAA